MIMRSSFRHGLRPFQAALFWDGKLMPAAEGLQIDLSPYLNNKAFGSRPGEASFDTTNRAFPPLNSLARDGVYTSTLTGVQYAFPGYAGSDAQMDNVICNSQTIPIPQGKFFSISMLIATDLIRKTISSTVNLTYTSAGGDGDDQKRVVSAELRAHPAWSWPTLTHGEIISPFTYTATGTDYNTSQIFEWTASLEAGEILTAITLPNTTKASSGRIHVFASLTVAGSGCERAKHPSDAEVDGRGKSGGRGNRQQCWV